MKKIKEFGPFKRKTLLRNERWFFSIILFLLEKIVIKIFATPEKFNLFRYVKNDILYNFEIVLGINFIENHLIFDKVR